MQTQAVKFESGWFIKNIPGLEGIKKKTIQVDIELADEEFRDLDYTEQKSIVIMERYLEKRKREVIIFNEKNADRTRFQHQFCIDSTPFSELIKRI
jgi:hypothetical protein